MQEMTLSKNKITKDTVILMMGLFYPALNNYIWRVVVAITGIFRVYFSNQVFNIIVWTLVLGYMVCTSRNPKISFKTCMIAIVFLFIALLSFILTDYEYFSASVLVTLSIGTLSFFFQGSLINLKKVSHMHLYLAAIVTLVLSIIYSVYTVDSQNLSLEDNMDFAYKVLPSVLIIFSWLFTKRNKTVAIIFSVIGTVFLILQGTRGPIFCLAAFICLMMYKKYGLGKSFFKVGIIAVVIAFLVNSQSVQKELVDLTNKIDSSGYSSRFITMALDEELSDANGREAIQETLINDIKEQPLRIRGMFSDRQATRGLIDSEYNTNYEKGTYAHSLWLELLYDWGVFFGGIILIAILFLLLKTIKKIDINDSYILMLFICIGFVHLFLSSSYLLSANFFFLIGLVMNCNTSKQELY